MSRRLEFSAQTKRDAFERSKDAGGTPRCECHRIPWMKPCGCALGPGNTFYEHILPCEIRNDNDLANCAALTKTCWRIKTDHYDRKVIAKSNHVQDNARGIRKHQFRPITGTRASGIKLPMRPFARPIDRDTGREL